MKLLNPIKVAVIEIPILSIIWDFIIEVWFVKIGIVVLIISVNLIVFFSLFISVGIIFFVGFFQKHM